MVSWSNLGLEKRCNVTGKLTDAQVVMRETKRTLVRMIAIVLDVGRLGFVVVMMRVLCEGSGRRTRIYTLECASF